MAHDRLRYREHLVREDSQDTEPEHAEETWGEAVASSIRERNRGSG
jgi:hypothetical protein